MNLAAQFIKFPLNMIELPLKVRTPGGLVEAAVHGSLMHAAACVRRAKAAARTWA